MYGKSYESKFKGSMMGAGFNVFAVWDYVITNTHFGVIELNPKLVAFTLAGARDGAEQEVIEAIDYLCRPDPKSRSQEEGGRRMIQEGEYQYRVVNWESYQQMRNENHLREYNRRKQAEYRAREKEKRILEAMSKEERAAYLKEYDKRRKYAGKENAAKFGGSQATKHGLEDAAT